MGAETRPEVPESGASRLNPAAGQEKRPEGQNSYRSRSRNRGRFEQNVVENDAKLILPNISVGEYDVRSPAADSDGPGEGTERIRGIENKRLIEIAEGNRKCIGDTIPLIARKIEAERIVPCGK